MEVLQLLQQALAKYLNVEQRAHWRAHRKKKKKKITSAVPCDETIIFIYLFIYLYIYINEADIQKYISLKIEFY